VLYNDAYEVLESFDSDHDQNIPRIDDNVHVEIDYDQNFLINCSPNRDPIVINIPFMHESTAQFNNDIQNNTTVHRDPKEIIMCLLHLHPTTQFVSTTFAPTPPLRTRLHNTRPKSTKNKANTRLDFKWVNGEFPYNVIIDDTIFEKPTQISTSYSYFKQFWSDDIIDLIVEETNIYSVQMSGKSINVKKK